MASPVSTQAKMTSLIIFCLHAFLLSFPLFTFHVCLKIKPGQHNLLSPAKIHSTTSTQFTDLPLSLDPQTVWTVRPAWWPVIYDIVVRILLTGSHWRRLWNFVRNISNYKLHLVRSTLLGSFPTVLNLRWTWQNKRRREYQAHAFQQNRLIFH